MNFGDVKDLPSTLSAQEIADLFGVGVDHVYAEVRAERWPTPTLKLGRKLVFPTVPALEALGLWPLPTEQPASGRTPFVALPQLTVDEARTVLECIEITQALEAGVRLVPGSETNLGKAAVLWSLHTAYAEAIANHS